MTAVVVLAAGLGSRLGASTHKSLVPVREDLGTLPLLLAALAGQAWVSAVSVVTGWRAAEVAAATKAVLPSARLVHNADYRSTGPLQSLACGVRADAPAATTWALTADAYYSPVFMAALAGFESDTSAAASGAVCVKHITAAEDPAAAIGVTVDGEWVRGLGPLTGAAGWILAQAFRWPADAVGAIRGAAGMGATSQWQLVNALVAGAAPGTSCDFRAVAVPADSCFDIDTPQDLAVARERLR